MIVAGDDGDVFGAPELILPQRLHEADAHQIVRDEHGVGPVLEQLEPRAIARLDAEIALDDQGGIERLVPVAERRAIAVEPPAARGRPAEPGDESNAAVAQAQQVRDAFVRRAFVVHFDDIGAQSRHCPGEKDERYAGACERALQRLGHRAGRLGEDDAVDALGHEQSEVDLFLAEVVVAARDEQHVAGVVGRVLGAPDHLWKERVGDVRHDHADRSGLLRREAAREQVGLVAELLHGALDAALERGAHERRAVDRRGHGGDRDAGGAGDVVDVRHRTV